MELTNEQKLLILLQKAVENGWEQPSRITNAIGWGIFIDANFCEFECSTNYGENIDSINDLVLNFEPGKIDFIEALFTALINEVQDVNEVRESYTGQFKLQFISLPTKDRLDYLFQTFNQLLK